MKALRLLGGLVVLAGIVLSTMRVLSHERGELEERVGPVTLERLRRTDPNRTEQTVRAIEANLQKGERYLVELCAQGRPDPATWAGGLDVVFWIPAAEKLVTRTALDAPRLAAGRAHAGRTCWTVAVGDAPDDGRYAVELFWPEAAPRPAIDRTPLSLRIAGYRLPDGNDRITLGVIAIGMLLLLAGFAAPAPSGPPQGTASLAAVAIGVVLLVFAVLAAGILAGGSSGILIGGAGAVVVQIVLAVTLSGRGASVTSRLALHRSAAGRLWIVPVAAAVVVGGSIGLQYVIPSTGVAPVEVAIAWPSGKLAFAALGLLVPAGEEVFFRGFVQGTLERRFGGRIALVATAVLFVAAHVPQQWGSWGALGGVAILGTVLGTLRHVSRALWPCIVAHFLYNGALVAISFV